MQSNDTFAPLRAQGCTITKDGTVYDRTGRELTVGEIQDMTQADYLTEFEHASRRRDRTTMNRIAAEHPTDNRVRLYLSHY